MGHTRKSVQQSTQDCVHFESVYMTYSFGMCYVLHKDYLNRKRLHHYEIFHLSWLLCHSLTVKASCEYVNLQWQLCKWQLLPNYCPACRTTLVATRFRVAVICPIIQVPHCIRVFFYFVWFVFINHIFQFYYELCTYCNILDIYLS